MSQIQLPEAKSWGGALLVSDLGVLQAQGADAATFLHGQLSQDTKGQAATEGRLAAYCSAKGRMLASMVTLRPEPETFWLLTDRQVLPGLLKRLQMFVLRAKAVLSDASATLNVVGLVGEVAQGWLGEAAGSEPWQARAHAGGQVLRLPDVQGVARWVWVGPASEAATVTGALPALPEAAWRWLDVMSGVPRIEATTVDQFVPQMVNFELIGGVNFKKGCYPGQEVVARSQYRGTTKRRAFVVHAAQALQPGQEVFSAADPAQPAGLVINTAPMPTASPSAGLPVDGGPSSALIELKLAAVGSALFAGSADGVALTLGSLPYDLPSAESAD
ncbi:folate-binding protein [Aquabacterium sp.]|uniref:CAF17-like 4Fe-4S cluster assembly/insertion protein YgfZ n=1 Tax=Aquabacterium sp. TaxID=1872578 RepID=UPI0025C55773|nr:folate-binding protein [Aquabacterium sp.]